MSAVNANEVLEDARTLHETGVGTNELKFIDILTRRSYQHLRCVFSAYRKIGGTDIETFINSEFSGDISKALSFLGACNASFFFFLIVWFCFTYGSYAIYRGRWTPLWEFIIRGLKHRRVFLADCWFLKKFQL